MADFRKGIFAFAVLALIMSFAVPASAQLTPALQCVANAGVPPTVRAEGLTELVGDLVLNCNGGVPTVAGNPVPAANVTIILSTPITSRLLTQTTGGITTSTLSEAILMIDEPHSPVNPLTPLLLCNASGIGGTQCGLSGTGNGVGTYSGVPAVSVGNPQGRVNAFQGNQTATNRVDFFGVPIDPPGTTATRIIRVTNIRANANYLNVSSTLVPSQITMYVSITGSTSVPINNPQQTVAYVLPGLIVSRTGTVDNFIQCQNQNSPIATDPATGTTPTSQHSVVFTEGFGSSFKVRNIVQVTTPNPLASVATLVARAASADLNQNVPGAIYNTEAGFQNNVTDPSPNPPGYTGTPLVGGTVNGAWSSGIGTATQGTRLMVQFNSIPTGTQIFVPQAIALTNILNTVQTGWAVLVTTDANGAGAFSPAATTASGYSPVSVSNASGTAVYEVLQSDPFAIERATVPVAVAYVSNVGNNLPAPGVTSSVVGQFAPQSSVAVASTSAPIPRFAPSPNTGNTFLISKCSCNVLFPFVTNSQGFDTGIAISNTSADIYGTAPQAGIVTLNYFSAGTPPVAQPTNAVVPAGQTLTFTLSGGGNFGIAATPGFQGYIIAQAQFQFCHAFAYISAQGALPTAPGASEGYLGIILDGASLERTGQLGENKGH